MELVFWTALASLFYIYVGYPLLLKIMPKKREPLVQQSTKPALAPVTVVIAAYNEADCIEATVFNKLTQTYPESLLDIIVVSDGSTDATDARVSAIVEQNPRVTLLVQSIRQGKTAALNRAVSQARGEIIIFSDANSLYAPDAINHLVRRFDDPRVGYVTGKMVYVNRDGAMVGDGCSAYMKYENYLRKEETRVGSIVGVDGGIDAIRKSLYRPLSADQLPDFVQPLGVIEQGYRVVFCESALLTEETTDNTATEFAMRIRVSLRAFWAMWDMKHLFNPFRYPIFSWQLFSHKLLRYLAFIPLVMAFISNAFLITQGAIYQASFIVQCGFYLLALAAHYSIVPNHALTRLAHYFCVLNFAALIAATLFIRGKKIVLWQPRGGAQ